MAGKKLVKRRVARKPKSPKKVVAKPKSPKKVVAKPKRKVEAKVATVCLEGYKISKNGKCVKDKNYNIQVLNIPLPPAAPAPKVAPAPRRFASQIRLAALKRNALKPMKLSDRKMSGGFFGMMGPRPQAPAPVVPPRPRGFVGLTGRPAPFVPAVWSTSMRKRQGEPEF